MSASTGPDLHELDNPPVRKSKRVHNDTGYLATLSEVVKLFAAEGLPTTSEIDARIVDLRIHGSLPIVGDEATNGVLSRPTKLRRSTTDENAGGKTLRIRVATSSHHEQQAASDLHTTNGAKLMREHLVERTDGSTSSRGLHDSNGRGDLTTDFLQTVKAQCERAVSSKIEDLFGKLQEGKEVKITVWHQTQELLKDEGEDILGQLNRVMRLTQHKPEGVEYPRSIIRPPARDAKLPERRRSSDTERATDPASPPPHPKVQSPRIAVAVKDFLDLASDVLRPQPQYREIMQRLSQYVIDGVGNLSDAEPLDAVSRPRYDRGVKAIHAAMDFVQAFPELHIRLRSFLASNEVDHRPGTSAAPVAAAVPSAAAVAAAAAAARAHAYAGVAEPTTVPVQYVPSPYPMYEFSYMYGVGYGYPYPHYSVPTATAEIKPPAAPAAAYGLPPGYSAYPYSVAAPSAKSVAEAMHYPRGSTIAYITAPPSASYSYPPGLVSYASGVTSAYLPAGGVPYAAPYVTHSYAVPTSEPPRHTSSTTSSRVFTNGANHAAAAAAPMLGRSPPLSSFHIPPPPTHHSVLRENGSP